MKNRVGFIGLGVMGAPMAKNLLPEYEVMVFDTDPVKMGKLPGAQRASGIPDVARFAPVVILSLPTSAAVKEVTIGSNGLMENMAPGSIIIDTSTTEPGIAQEIAKTLASRGIYLLDAPVSGGEKGAIEGKLSIMVGGDETAYERCLPLLRCLGTSVVRMGESGLGQVAKLVNNMIVGVTFAAVAEGMALATRSGLDPKLLYEAIRGGWAGSKVLDVSAEAILSRDFRPGGTVNIHWKDLGYALSLAKDKDVPVPMCALTHEIFKAARAFGRGGLSQPAIVNLWEELLGIEVK